MTALDAAADGNPQSSVQEQEAAPVPATAPGPLAGDPAILGLPSFIAGSVALGLTLVGVVPATAAGAPLTLGTLRLPLAFTAVFALIDVALLLLLIATIQASSGLAKTAGYVVLAFAALGVYLFFGSAGVATGGKALPLGRPVLHG